MPKPLEMPCPKCGAPAKQKCRLPSGTARPDPHDERVAAAKTDRRKPPLRVETFELATGSIVRSVEVSYAQAERAKRDQLTIIDRDEHGVRIVDQQGKPW